MPIERPAALRQRLDALIAELTELVGERSEAETDHTTATQECQHDLRVGLADLGERHEREQAEQEAEAEARWGRFQTRRDERAAKQDKARQAERAPLLTAREAAREAAEEKLVKARERKAAKIQKQLDRMDDDQERQTRHFTALKDGVGKLSARLGAVLAKLSTATPPGYVGPEPKRQDADTFLAEAQDIHDRLARSTVRVEGSWGAHVGTWGGVLGVCAVALVVTGVSYLIAPQHALYVLPGGGALLLSALIWTLNARGSTRRAALGLLGSLSQTAAALGAQERLNQDHQSKAYKALLEKRMTKLSSAERDHEQASKGKLAELDAQLEEVDARHAELASKLEAADVAAKAKLEGELAAAAEAIAARHVEERAALEAQLAERQAGIDRVRDEVFARCDKAWADALDGLRRSAQTSSEQAAAGHLSWAALEDATRDWPERCPDDIKLAELSLPLDALLVPEHEALALPAETLRWPLTLAFPGHGSLLIKAGAAGRERAVELLFSSAIRLLASFPPGMAKLTVIDPVALGQGFSGLMELADHDEGLINGRIWTEGAHIERQLAELTEHMEKVIQKYLRNRFESIASYNASAGEMQEAYQFLIISDLPVGLNDVALERLASIVSSGARCGVHALVFHDTRHAWPKALDEALFQRSGLVLDMDGAAPKAAGLELADVAIEPSPPAPLITPLLAETGRRAIDAQKVELSFAAVAPQGDEIWSRSSARGFRVPIGRSGATKLQELDLGKGTAQHALIAGKTGSGKSTLFHVLITSAALWYAPDELDLYLIDFKKGVEFKTYATHKLPHAGVVAIESDREFGAAVLRRLDQELDRRGERFREAGVQDLASWREATGETMPRMVLLIDEFQEFFSEDDAVAHEASLMLDRFVRQGRAFGLHVIFGSQTLSGVYSLAKSTLGQVGVRVALQCNESDSYLILGEDNGAARLLSRPGEAIYNDMGGLVEGNNPFQVVWLPDTLHDELLADVSQRSAALATPPAAPIIFESSAAAQLIDNAALAARLGGEPAPGEDVSLWLGEPNAIKSSTEARFGPTASRHLLILGQRLDAVFGMTCSAILSLASSLPPERLRLVLLDGSGADDHYQRHLERVEAAIPHAIERVPFKEAADAVASLAAGVEAAQNAGEQPEVHTFVFVLGLHRFRALRSEDDFSVSADDPGAQLASLLKDGPEQRLHLVVWCDSLASANRSLTRRTMREFDQLALFQMSASDSAELIDSRAANTLGLTNALLFVESEGTSEKFRPYAPPSERWLDGAASQLASRGWQPVDHAASAPQVSASDADAADRRAEIEAELASLGSFGDSAPAGGSTLAERLLGGDTTPAIEAEPPAEGGDDEPGSTLADRILGNPDD